MNQLSTKKWAGSFGQFTDPLRKSLALEGLSSQAVKDVWPTLADYVESEALSCEKGERAYPIGCKPQGVPLPQNAFDEWDANEAFLSKLWGDQDSYLEATLTDGLSDDHEMDAVRSKLAEIKRLKTRLQSLEGKLLKQEAMPSRNPDEQTVKVNLIKTQIETTKAEIVAKENELKKIGE
ncbi:hypothetical protein [Planctomycetes bacterium TBK1r]|uniref:Uncharacterized protein n=1 Tax=Stieleria magnilauensis TaxID=2527963 RepID=A0ABX5Y370_9BACT|nr:hypothetical protein TBK1r_64360 [Planctomycetes bacterium TBK1r]